MRKYWDSVEELHDYATKAVGSQIKDIVNEESVEYYYEKPKGKGWIGNSIEQDYFGLPNNNRAECDFPEIQTELKVTPIKKIGSGKSEQWSAKERLVLNIFNFHDEYKRSFEEASFIEKSELIELLFYEYIKDIPSPNLYIKAATTIDFKDLPEEDYLIIKQDWEMIINKIKAGKAEELSDSLTKYLGATTKGSKSIKNMTTQPFSDKMAHRRAFTLKTSYMTALIRNIMSDEKNREKVVKDSSDLENKSFDDIILEQFQPYIGKTKEDLATKFNINIPSRNDKASSHLLAKQMLNIDSDIEETEEFQKAGIAVKIVTIQPFPSSKYGENKIATENLKIQNYFNFEEVVNETWETSTLYEYLSSTQFLLVIFERKENNDIFKGAKFWRVPTIDLEGKIKEVWEDTQQKLKNGVTLSYKETKHQKGFKVDNNFINQSDDKILHVRPDANYSQYRPQYTEIVNGKRTTYNNSMLLPSEITWANLPDNYNREDISGNYMTKQAFWFNSQYMYKQVKELIQ